MGGHRDGFCRLKEWAGMGRKGSEAIEPQLLREWLAVGEGTFVSGEALAEACGVSRVTVLNRIRAMRGRGYLIEGRHRLGYRLNGWPGWIDLAAVKAMVADFEADQIFYLEETGSTNDAIGPLLGKVAEGSVVGLLAGIQTAGRGRRGRRWESGARGNLYLSLGFQPLIAPSRMGRFTLWMGLAAAMELERCVAVRLDLKWPNDLLFEGAKVGGILTEAKVDSETVLQVVLGIGVNINADAEDLMAVKDRRTTSLRQISGKPRDPNRVAAGLLDGLGRAFRAYLDGNFERVFAREWPERDILRGKCVEVDFMGERIEGMAEGIGPGGELLVRASDGRLRMIQAGEATLKTGLAGGGDSVKDI